MGAVHRATETKLNRNVAIKMVPDAFADDWDRLERFTRGAQALAGGEFVVFPRDTLK
jgi:eukaryotic-like serine/threonine-protein kinase